MTYTFMPSLKQQQDFHKEFNKFLITAEILYRKLNNPFLRTALSKVGLNLKVRPCKRMNASKLKARIHAEDEDILVCVILFP